MEANQISCPSCGHSFNVSDAVSGRLKLQFDEQLKKEKEELSKRFYASLENNKKELDQKIKDQERELVQRYEKDKELQRKLLEEQVHKDFEVQLIGMQQELEKKRQESIQFQRIQLENENLKSTLQQQRVQIELEVKKQANEELDKAIKSMKDTVTGELEMKMRDKDVQLDSLRKQIDEMKRRAEQGSMQLQGESQELALEELLHNFFPTDTISEVGKGVRGADVVQTVTNRFGQECGKIIYESKRTKNFSNEWLGKLKEDMRTLKASVAVLVTEAMPPEMEHFGQREGIWVCTFSEVKSLAFVLRDSILRIHDVATAQENKGDKMTMLYNFITSDEFRNHIDAIVEGFVSIRDSITKERAMMEKIWREREKQLEKALFNTTGLYGSIKGIAGSSVGDIKLLEE